jgi:sulfur carrier protein
MVEIYLEREDKMINKKLTSPVKLKELLEEMNISVSSIILTKNGEVTLEDDMVDDNDKVQILSVVSGG